MLFLIGHQVVYDAILVSSDRSTGSRIQVAALEQCFVRVSAGLQVCSLEPCKPHDRLAGITW